MFPAAYSNIVSATVTEGATKVCTQMFWDCVSLRDVSLPDTVASIGQHAFQNCAALAELTIPNSCRSIGGYAVQGCDALWHVTGPHRFESQFRGWLPGVTYTYSDVLVTLEPNGGKVEPAELELELGGALEGLPTPRRKGYAFMGWWTAGDGGTEVSEGDSTGGATELTLYARWEELPRANLKGYKPKAWPAAIFLARAEASTNMVSVVGTGEQVYLKFCYGNFGEGAAEDHRVAVVVKNAGGRAVANWDGIVDALAINQIHGETNCSFSVASAGTYTAIVTLDSDGELPELDENDNELRLEFTVMAPQAVTFLGNGGAPEAQTNSYPVGGTYSPLPEAAWGGCAFGGWWTSATGGEQVTEDTPVTEDASARTLWAHWAQPNLRGYKPKAWPAAIFLTKGAGSTNMAAGVWTGETVWLKFCYGNFGEIEAGTHRVEAVVEDGAGSVIATWTRETNSLAVNQIYGATDFAFSVAEAGRYTAVVTLDADDTLAESGEDDNELRLEFTVSDPQTVTFIGNGGMPEEQTYTYAVGETYDPLPEATLEGHAFGGWWTAEEGGEQVTTATQVTGAAERTLWAHWVQPNLKGYKPKAWPAAIFLTREADSTNVTESVWTGETAYLRFCYGNFGTVAMGTHRVSAVVTNTQGQVIAGGSWTNGGLAIYEIRPGILEVRVEEEGTYAAVVTLDPDGAIDESDESDNEIRLEFTAALPTEQRVAFDANGGTCGTTEQTYAVGEPYGELPTAKRSGGYAFLGWWTEEEGGELVTEESVVEPHTSLTLWAHWTTEQVTAFLGNGGKPAVQTTTNTIYADYGTLPEAKWSGHAFVGWFNAPEGGKRVYTNSTVTLAATRTLYAQWTDQQVTTFKANGGYPATQKTTNTIYADYGAFPEVKYSGHALVGWFNAPEGGKRIYTNSTVTLATGRTLYAQWTTNQVTTFKGNGGTPEIQKTTNAIYTHYGTLPEAVWENHAFLGWFNHPTKGKRVYTNSTVTLSATRSLYAHWTDKQVVTFKGNGGNPATAKTTNTMGTAYGTLPTPKKSGYALLGWFTAADGGSEVTAADIVPVGTSRTLYAHWTDQQVTTFLGNGGTPETQATTNTIYAKYAFPPTPAWDGHTFQGWYNAAEGGKRVYTNSTVTLAATRTLYAHWTTGKGFAITAIAVGASDGDEGPAPRAVLGEDRAENVCRLRFELSAGTEYEIQWTPSMAAEWETVERLVAETDGEVEVEIEVPGGEKGFFRLVVFETAGKAD